MRVLIVDDSRAIRFALAKRCRELGLEAAEAADGAEGLARLQDARYDVVILDVTMPVMSGLEMLRALRGGGDDTPIILLTSDNSIAKLTELEALSPFAFIPKPFELDALFAVVLRAGVGEAPRLAS